MAKKSTGRTRAEPKFRKSLGTAVDERVVIEFVGANCAAFRRERALSLDALAKIAGLSKGMLVEIEQRRTNPSISTLCRIANALQVGLWDLLSERMTASRLVRHSPTDGKQLWHTAAGSTAVLIDAARVLDVGGELWRWRLEPAEAFDGVAHPAGTTEFLHVLRGTLTVEVGREALECGVGESLRIRADAPHRYRNLNDQACEFMMCVIEPVAQQ